MRQNDKTGVFAFFCLTFLSRALALFTFVVTDRGDFAAGDRPVVFLPYFVLGALTSLPVLAVCGKNQDRTVFSLARRLSPAAAGVTAVLYTAGALWSAAVSAVRLDLFMSTVMFADGRMFVLLALLTGAAVWLARGGLAALARCSLPVLALLAGSLLYVGLTAGGGFHAANLEPPLQNGLWPPVKSCIAAVARTGELAAPAVLAPQIAGNIKKGTLRWLAAFGIMVSALYTVVQGVTGAYGERQMFQLYTLTELSKIGVFERLDALICAVWVLCSLLRMAFHIYTAGCCLEGGFGVKKTAGVYAALGAGALSIYAPLARCETVFFRVIGSGVNEVLFTVLVLVLPLLLLIFARVKKNERGLSHEKKAAPPLRRGGAGGLLLAGFQNRRAGNGRGAEPQADR